MVRHWLAWGMGLALVTGGLPAQTPPPLSEVLSLVRSNLTDLRPAEVDAAATESLLAKLGPRARLLESYDEPAISAEAIVDSTVYDGQFAYVRFGEIGTETAPRLASLLDRFAATNSLTGCVLDLRFAGGRDFNTAALVAGQFLPPAQPLLDWGEGLKLAPVTTNAWTHPVMVLMNRQTRGAAEAIAATLRQSGRALLIGTASAGEASVYRDFPLSTGQRLRLAVADVRTGNGQAIPAAGLTPDLAVKISPEAERGYLVDPYTPIRSQTNSLTATNTLTTVIRVRKKVSEADLVRERAGGEAPAPADAPDAPPKVVRDPVLGRALDLLKGLSLLNTRSG